MKPLVWKIKHAYIYNARLLLGITKISQLRWDSFSSKTVAIIYTANMLD